MPTENIADVHDTLSRIYGAVAAVVRDDRLGSDLLLEDLHESFLDAAELLAALSFTTLDRLDAALAAGPQLSPHEREALAQSLLTEAHGYAISDVLCVQSAARRLDAVRRNDHDEVVAELAQASALATDRQLLRGAMALLTATVSMWAQRSGQSPRRAAATLCMAASVSPGS